MEHVIAAYYLGCFVFALNGLIWMANRNTVRMQRAAAESTERMVRKYVRKRGVR